MGYKGYVTDEHSQYDLYHDLKKCLGRKIEIGPDPYHEKWYVLESEEHGLDEFGLFIVFTLRNDDGSLITYPVRGIKEFDYEIYNDHIKYHLGLSDEPFRKMDWNNIPPEGFPVQSATRYQRFILKVGFDDVTDNAEQARRLGFKGVPNS